MTDRSQKNLDNSRASKQSLFLDDRFSRGLEQFNQQEFFDCHETWEALWKNLSGTEKELLQGLIQIAVAYYHALRENQAGAIKLMERGIPRVKKALHENLEQQLQLFEFIAQVESDLAELKNSCPVSSLKIPALILTARHQ